jgi:hypothetical protein
MAAADPDRRQSLGHRVRHLPVRQPAPSTGAGADTTDETAAFEGLSALRDLHKEGSISLYASSLIVKDRTGRVSVKQEVDRGPAGGGGSGIRTRSTVPDQAYFSRLRPVNRVRYRWLRAPPTTDSAPRPERRLARRRPLLPPMSPLLYSTPSAAWSDHHPTQWRGKITAETDTSSKPDLMPERAVDALRAHRGIESMHRVLDVTLSTRTSPACGAPLWRSEHGTPNALPRKLSGWGGVGKNSSISTCDRWAGDLSNRSPKNSFGSKKIWSRP